MKNNLVAKKRLVVIFGGCSSEYSISCKSAYSIINHIDYNKYDLFIIGITKSGEWFLYEGDISKIFDETWEYDHNRIPVVISPNRNDHGILLFYGTHFEKIRIDGVFPILHGRNGEDGTVQGLIELSGIPLIGCGTLSSALCMDKKIAHDLVGQIGIKTPKSIKIDKQMLNINLDILVSELKYPLFIKPVRSGSSIGITQVFRREDLLKAIDDAFKYDDSVIIEETIDGVEIGCAILGNEEIIIGELDEIELTTGFFNYTEKYSLITSKIHVPARIDSDTAKKIKECAVKIYKVLCCKGFARVDVFLSSDGDIFFNEVNTIPGFTANSRYPKMLKCTGLSFENIIDKIIKLEIK